MSTFPQLEDNYKDLITESNNSILHLESISFDLKIDSKANHWSYAVILMWLIINLTVILEREWSKESNQRLR